MLVFPGPPVIFRRKPGAKPIRGENRLLEGSGVFGTPYRLRIPDRAGLERDAAEIARSLSVRRNGNQSGIEALIRLHTIPDDAAAGSGNAAGPGRVQDSLRATKATPDAGRWLHLERSKGRRSEPRKGAAYRRH
jgi:hypothetical protein